MPSVTQVKTITQEVNQIKSLLGAQFTPIPVSFTNIQQVNQIKVTIMSTFAPIPVLLTNIQQVNQLCLQISIQMQP